MFWELQFPPHFYRIALAARGIHIPYLTALDSIVEN